MWLVPGVDPDDLELTFENGTLAIAGKRGEHISAIASRSTRRSIPRRSRPRSTRAFSPCTPGSEAAKIPVK
jgi:HSP20 family molecular chaperone IbpA